MSVHVTNLLSGFFSILTAVSCSGVIYQKTEDLHQTLLTNYQSDIRPGLDNAGPLLVSLTFHLTSLNDLDEVRGEMNTVGYIQVSWVEDRMTWNPAAYAGIWSILFPMEKIWTPLLLLGNPSLKISYMNSEAALVRVLYNGTALWLPGDVFRTKCYPDIYRYPYDAQRCAIGVLPWGYLGEEIMLDTPEPYVNTPFYEDNGEWILMKTETSTSMRNGFAVSSFYLTFNRRPQFFFVNVLLPIVFLSALNVLVFVIPVESGERVSYSITVLLSFAVFMTLVSDNIPKTSAPMSLLCYYLISVFSGSALVMIGTIVNLRMFYRNESQPKPRMLVALATWMTAPRCCKSSVRTKPDMVTEVCVITHGNGHHDNQDVSQKKRNAHLFEDIEDQGDLKGDENLTWSDLSRGMDRFMMVSFVFYFTAATIGHMLAIMVPSESSIF